MPEGFDPGAIDEVIHGRMRLGIMAHLSQASPAAFTELAQALGATNGNLSVHLTKLEAAGYVKTEKARGRGRGLTTVSLTAAGRAAWVDYLETLRGLFPGA